MNQITHFLDSSNVYGSDEEDVKQLRQYEGGLLKTYKPDPAGPRSLLPQEGEEGKDECAIEEAQQVRENRKCFVAGETPLAGPGNPRTQHQFISKTFNSIKI